MMITVQEADQFILTDIKICPAVHVPLEKAYGQVLREDLVADRDLPPFHRVTMDGIAVNFSSLEKEKRTFPIVGMQNAGIPALTLKEADTCIEVMTGAVLPDGCDCVIPIENVDINNGEAKLRDDLDLSRMQNVHQQASDHKREDILVPKGHRLYSPQIAVAASIGKSDVCVSQSPKIAVIGTGDELVPVDQKTKPYQIHQSNSYALQSALELHGYDSVTRFHIKDDRDELEKRLSQILKDFDVLVLSGGVSMGKFDYVPEVLASIGVKVLFHKVKQRPGKPFWFGKSEKGKPVFALPGNPVSTQIGMHRYILPYVNRAVGAKLPAEEFAVLGEDVDVGTEFTYFLPVKISGSPEGQLIALPVTPAGSGDYVSLAQSDGFVELAPETIKFSQGFTARLYRWKS